MFKYNHCYYSYLRPLISSTKFHSINGSKISNFNLTNRLFTTTQSSKYEHILTEEKDSSLYVYFNRPEIHNAFNEKLIAELTHIFQSVSPSSLPSVSTSKYRSIILTGKGKSFSAGADLNWMTKMAGYSEMENRSDSLRLYDMFASIRDCPIPTIAQINGTTLGGGCGLISACDIAIAINTAQFGLTEVKLGLIPAVISPFVVSKIGQANARRYFLTGQKFTAQTAQSIGLIHHVANSTQELEGMVNEIVTEINSSGPLAVEACKRLLGTIDKHSGAQLRGYVADKIARLRVSAEGQHGLRSFLNKSKPNWIKK